jgi:hypothetical protein
MNTCTQNGCNLTLRPKNFLVSPNRITYRYILPAVINDVYHALVVQTHKIGQAVSSEEAVVRKADVNMTWLPKIYFTGPECKKYQLFYYQIFRKLLFRQGAKFIIYIVLTIHMVPKYKPQERLIRDHCYQLKWVPETNRMLSPWTKLGKKMFRAELLGRPHTGMRQDM